MRKVLVFLILVSIVYANNYTYTENSITLHDIMHSGQDYDMYIDILYTTNRTDSHWCPTVSIYSDTNLVKILNLTSSSKKIYGNYYIYNNQYRMQRLHTGNYSVHVDNCSKYITGDVVTITIYEKYFISMYMLLLLGFLTVISPYYMPNIFGPCIFFMILAIYIIN